jgi:2-haloacid dehalogenase
MARYEDFWTVTEHALRFAVARLGLSATESQIAALMDSYLALACFPEVPGALARLAPQPLGILSNGAPRMLAAVVRANGLEHTFQHVLSVDTVKIYKPSSKVYEMGTRAFGLPPHDILFVSSNAWDVAGAKAFGYQTCWCNRQKAPMDVLGVTTDHEVERLDQIWE